RGGLPTTAKHPVGNPCSTRQGRQAVLSFALRWDWARRVQTVGRQDARRSNLALELHNLVHRDRGRVENPNARSSGNSLRASWSTRRNARFPGDCAHEVSCVLRFSRISGLLRRESPGGGLRVHSTAPAGAANPDRWKKQIRARAERKAERKTLAVRRKPLTARSSMRSASGR